MRHATYVSVCALRQALRVIWFVQRIVEPHYDWEGEVTENYINLNVALWACGHNTPELTKAISDCQEVINNLHNTAVKARQNFDDVGLQGTLREHCVEAEKEQLI